MASVKGKSAQSASAVSRLTRDYKSLVQDPVPSIVAVPKEDNLFVCHYVILGAEESPYEGGFYHGKLVFPPDYPFNPPSIYMITPNGRFKCNTRLCLSISDFHPEAWNPAWSISTILVGLLSFMLEDQQTFGSIVTSPEEKKKFAKESLQFNLQDEEFCSLFPEVVEIIKDSLNDESSSDEEMEQQDGATSNANQSSIPNSSQWSVSFKRKVIRLLSTISKFKHRHR